MACLWPATKADVADAKGKERKAEKEEQPQQKGRILTMERFRRLQESSKTSFTAFKAAMNGFHLVVHQNYALKDIISVKTKRRDFWKQLKRK